MKLSELEPEFYRYDRRLTDVDICLGDPETWRARGCPSERRQELRDHKIPTSFNEAQCLWFLCPKCFQENGTIMGTHYIEVTFANRGVLTDQGMKNKKGEFVQWKVSGTGINDLTITSSILLESSCGWHGFITNGDVS